MPSDQDDFTDKHCWIVTIPSRGAFHLYGDDPSEIKITDIANALGHQCRYTGHMQPWAWYSGAEHSCDVAWVVKQLGGNRAQQFAGLMHDTPEYGLSDIAAPFKRELGNYYAKEALIWKRIAAKYGIEEKLPDIVKQADWICLFLEAATFVVPKDWDYLSTWVGWNPHGMSAFAKYEQWVPRWKFRRPIMRGLTYKQAPAEFLRRFRELYEPS